MNKKECMTNLWETIKNRKPVKVYLLGDYFDTMSYNEELNRYEGVYGNIPMEKVPLIIDGDESVDHIKLEVLWHKKKWY